MTGFESTKFIRFFSSQVANTEFIEETEKWIVDQYKLRVFKSNPEINRMLIEWAIRHKSKPIFKLTKQCLSDKSNKLKGNLRDSLLHLAVSLETPTLTTFLLEKLPPEQKFQRDCFGESPLDIAIRKQHETEPHISMTMARLLEDSDIRDHLAQLKKKAILESSLSFFLNFFSKELIEAQDISGDEIILNNLQSIKARIESIDSVIITGTADFLLPGKEKQKKRTL